MAHTRGLEFKPGDRRISGLAGADLSAYLLYHVDTTSNATVTLAGTTSYNCGVPLVAAKSGQPVTLVQNGLLIVTCSEGINVGQPVMAAASGKVAVATVGTHHVIGIALTPTTADGQTLTIEKL